MDTNEAQKTLENPDFEKLMETIDTLSKTAAVELNLQPEEDDGNVEYKFKFDAPTMDRVQHLTT
jgi:hypothetical protein